MDEQRVILDHLYKEIQSNCRHCDVVRLNSYQQSDMAVVLRQYEYQSYERVVVFTRLKRQRQQLALLRCISGLVFIEHDACQNYMAGSKYQGAYVRFYQRLSWVRVICSGWNISKQISAAGVDATFVSKGYDESFLRNVAGSRDVPAAFVGSTRSKTYSARAQMLEDIAERAELTVVRTDSGSDYLKMLNRIRIFVSADVGMGEYMIKNFEAMACGCMLLAWDQGAEENAALGFEDGLNVMLYRSAQEAVDKLAKLQADPELVQRIARAGQVLAEQRYTFARVGKDLACAIQAPMRPWPGLSLWQRIWVRMRYGIQV